MRQAPTRRELVGGAAAASAALLASSRVSLADTRPLSDPQLIALTLRVEQLVVIAYRRVLASRRLEPPVAGVVRQILGQELVHVATLEHELRSLGSTPPPPPRDLEAAQRGLATRHTYTSLTELRDQNECLKLLIDVESVAEGVYFEAVGKLTDAGLLRLSAEIMGCEAQHWSVLAAIRHHGDVLISVPYPFVQGSS